MSNLEPPTKMPGANTPTCSAQHTYSNLGESLGGALGGRLDRWPVGQPEQEGWVFHYHLRNHLTQL